MIKLKRIIKRKRPHIRFIGNQQFASVSENDPFSLFKPSFTATCQFLPLVGNNNANSTKYLFQTAVGITGTCISAYVIERKDIALGIFIGTFCTIGVEVLKDMVNQIINRKY